MTNSAVAVDRSEAFHLSLTLTTKVTLNHDALVLDHSRDLNELLFAQFTSTNVWIHTGVLKDL